MPFEVVYRESQLRGGGYGIVFVAQIEMWRSIDLIPSLIDLIIFSLQVKKKTKSQKSIGRSRKSTFSV